MIDIYITASCSAILLGFILVCEINGLIKKYNKLKREIHDMIGTTDSVYRELRTPKYWQFKDLQLPKNTV